MIAESVALVGQPLEHSAVRGASRVWLRRSSNRVFDVTLALVALIFFAPIIGGLAAAIAMQADGPVLFRQSRVGYGGRRFTVLKFRSMVSDSAAVLAAHLGASPQARAEWDQNHKLRDDPRITAFGKFLRKSSLDELPQFWNVLTGDMSIVGPRPIVEGEIVRYGRFFSAYCSVRPGITGLWQVSGRNDVSYKRRVCMDALYARKKSVLLDFKLVLATVPAVLLRRGSY